MIPNFPQEYERAWKLPPARKVTWARVFLLICCSSPSNTLDARDLYFLTHFVILKDPKALFIIMVHPFLIHLRFLSVLRLCVLRIVRCAILSPWPFDTDCIRIILTRSVYKLLFFDFSVRRVRVCRVRGRLPVNGETNKPLIHVPVYLLNAVSVSVSVSATWTTTCRQSYRIWLYFRIWANPITMI